MVNLLTMELLKIFSMARKPKYYQWDPEMVFLGTLDNAFDLYYRPETNDVYAYYDDQQGSFFNGIRFATKDGLPSLYEAKKRAKKRGLL